MTSVDLHKLVRELDTRKFHEPRPKQVTNYLAHCTQARSFLLNSAHPHMHADTLRKWLPPLRRTLLLQPKAAVAPVAELRVSSPATVHKRSGKSHTPAPTVPKSRQLSKRAGHKSPIVVKITKRHRLLQHSLWPIINS